MIRTEPEIRKKITDYEAEAQPWIEDNYDTVVRLFRAHIKGLRYAIGEDYDLKTGVITKMTMRTEKEIREYIANLEEESQEYVAYDAVIRQFRAIIKGAKYALGEDYSITQGK
jgi:hypothetical protein